jgi:hypothetical protein
MTRFTLVSGGLRYFSGHLNFLRWMEQMMPNPGQPTIGPGATGDHSYSGSMREEED